MGGGQEMTRPLREQEPGRDSRHANAAGTQKLAHRKSKRHNAGTPYCVTPSAGNAFSIVLSGREQWALNELRKAGASGCTPIDNPAPRWSAYVHRLRERGVEIETIREPHEGEFPGSHGRYVLRSQVRPVRAGGAQ